MNNFFKLCTPTQKTWLESIFVPCIFDTPETLIKEGEVLHTLYLIRDGEIEVYKENKKITVLRKGDFVGSLERLHKNIPAVYTFKNSRPVSLFALPGNDLKFFIDKNPGLLMKFTYEIMEK